MLLKPQLLSWLLRSLRDRLHTARFINNSPNNSPVRRCRLKHRPPQPNLHCKQLPQFPVYYFVYVRVNRAHAAEVSYLVADILGGREEQGNLSLPERTASFHFYAPRHPEPRRSRERRRIAVQAFLYRRGCSDLKRHDASCSFISSALRRRRRGTRGVPPVCV